MMPLIASKAALTCRIPKLHPSAEIFGPVCSKKRITFSTFSPGFTRTLIHFTKWQINVPIPPTYQNNSFHKDAVIKYLSTTSVSHGAKKSNTKSTKKAKSSNLNTIEELLDELSDDEDDHHTESETANSCSTGTPASLFIDGLHKGSSKKGTLFNASRLYHSII